MIERKNPKIYLGPFPQAKSSFVPRLGPSTIFHERPLLVNAGIRAGNFKSTASNGC
jgi:hypothetical protein